MIQGGQVGESTSGTLTKLIQSGIEVEEGDPALQTQSAINQRVERSGQVVETLGIVQESQGSGE